MIVKINNLDLENIHIDTYQMLTGESADEMFLYNENENSDKELTYDDFEWEYDHKAIVVGLAHASINTVLQAIAHIEYAEIIKDITFVSAGSPTYYNYTTDHYIMDIEVHIVKLNNYIGKHYDAIYEKAKGYDVSIIDGEVSKESLAHAGVCHILDNCITADDYNMAMWEIESDVYDEHTTVTLIETTNK